MVTVVSTLLPIEVTSGWSEEKVRAFSSRLNLLFLKAVQVKMDENASVVNNKVALSSGEHLDPPALSWVSPWSTHFSKRALSIDWQSQEHSSLPEEGISPKNMTLVYTVLGNLHRVHSGLTALKVVVREVDGPGFVDY